MDFLDQGIMFCPVELISVTDYEACAHERKVEKRVNKFPSCKNSF